jgi:hypothetical protein
LPFLNFSDEADYSDDSERWLTIVSTWQIIERVGDNEDNSTQNADNSENAQTTLKGKSTRNSAICYLLASLIDSLLVYQLCNV